MMPIDVLEQVRQLAEAFDEYVDDVSIDDVIGDTDGIGREEPPPTRLRSDLGHDRAWRRYGVAAAAVLLVAGLVTALAWIDRGGSKHTSSSPPPLTEAPAPVSQLDRFVWPAPARSYATLNELVTAFSAEMLGWDAFELDGDLSEARQPQFVTISNTAVGVGVTAIAVPSPDGWGFVQIGQPVDAKNIDTSGVMLTFPGVAGVASASVTVRLSDGTAVDTIADAGGVELPGVQLEQLVSALLIGRDANGQVIMASGGQFSSDPLVPTTTVGLLAGDAGAAYGPLDYATTDSWLPMWPSVNASEPPATTTGYGMSLCDSGNGTKVLRVDPASGPAHAYSGTLCVFIELTQPRPDAVTTCATTTERFNYARCQRRTDQTDSVGAGTSVLTVADEPQQTAMAVFPTATRWDQPEVFDADVTTVERPEVDFTDDTVAVDLTADIADPERRVDMSDVCFTIELPGATAEGCVGRSLLATGLTYGAFQDGDGPIEIVGIVPDEVATIEIAGTTLTPINNIWHYTATEGTPTTITVRSADGRSASTS
jgi:hypothetical protein